MHGYVPEAPSLAVAEGFCRHQSVATVSHIHNNAKSRLLEGSDRGSGKVDKEATVT